MQFSATLKPLSATIFLCNPLTNKPMKSKQTNTNTWITSVLRQAKQVVVRHQNLQTVLRSSKKDDITIITREAMRDNAIDGLQTLLQGKIF